MVESQPSGRRLGRSGPTASSEMGGFRRFGEAPEVELSDGTFEPGLLRPGHLLALIHRSAWNRNSANFAFWGFSEVRFNNKFREVRMYGLIRSWA
jgi:hypothetical protein